MYSIEEIMAVLVIFSFFGYVMECLVIRKEKGHFENRGMARGPFLPIYGVAVVLFSPFFVSIEHSYVLVFLLGSTLATIFELTVGGLMKAFFGRVWWDYSEKPLNFKGIICLESTIGWGLVAIVVIKFALKGVLAFLALVPEFFLQVVAVTFPVFYGVDLVYTVYERKKEWKDEQNNQKV